MSIVTIDHTGSIALPADLRHRYGLDPSTAVRIVATDGGILLVPLNSVAIPVALQHELEVWQSFDTASWNKFPFEETLR